MTTAVTIEPPPETALQIAFTSEGLRALGVRRRHHRRVLRTSSSPAWPTSPAARAASATSARTHPRAGQWGGSDATCRTSGDALRPHGQLGGLGSRGPRPGWQRAFAVSGAPADRSTSATSSRSASRTASASRMLDWERELDRRRARAARVSATSLALGEVLLGYPNEYGCYTDRPLLDPAFDAAADDLPPAEDAPDRRDLGRNGSYLVFRQLHQDVRRLLAVRRRAGRRRPAGARAAGRARWSGGTRDGEPLVAARPKLIAGIGVDPARAREHGFTLRRRPGRHPLPARRRTSAAPIRAPATCPVAAAGLWLRLLRMLGFERRGLARRPGGVDAFPPAGAPRPRIRPAPAAGASAARPAADEPPRAATSSASVANISRQFEFVQNAWMSNAKFDGLSDESDPLLGNREPSHGGGRHRPLQPPACRRPAVPARAACRSS